MSPEPICWCGHLRSAHGPDVEGNLICTGCDCDGYKKATAVEATRARVVAQTQRARKAIKRKSR